MGRGQVGLDASRSRERSEGAKEPRQRSEVRENRRGDEEASRQNALVIGFSELRGFAALFAEKLRFSVRSADKCLAALPPRRQSLKKFLVAPSVNHRFTANRAAEPRILY